MQSPRSSTATPLIRSDVAPQLRSDVQAGSALFQRVWTIDAGLGPFVNAQTCVACHAYPTAGGTASTIDDFVLFSPEVVDPSGGHAFARFEVRAIVAARPRQLPRQVSRRRPPSLFGLGLLEAVAPEDADPPAKHRFGWKARFGTIDEAVAAAFVNELGLTSPQTAHGRTPEINADDVRLVGQFVRLLPPPQPAASVPDGRRVFQAIGCGSCHRPTLRTGPSALPPLRNRTISPYTDLRLHDLGVGVGDGWNDGETSGTQFRTPVLWGLHSRGGPYLHDGRAPTLDAAILAHGGEAGSSQSAYRRLSPPDRERLLRFLAAL
jgi:CxxC motif-containing protein (DUF1111 family)